MNRKVNAVNLKDLEPRMLSKGMRVWRFGLASLGSDKLQLSLAEFDPSCEEHTWIFKNIDEIMYILKGRLKLRWEDGELELKGETLCSFRQELNFERVMLEKRKPWLLRL